MWVMDGCVLVVAGYSDSCIVCVQSCRKAEAFAEQTGGKRSYMCLHVAHSSSQTCTHTHTHIEYLNKSTQRTLLKVSLKWNIRLSETKSLQEKRKLICSALSKMKMSKLLLKTNTVTLQPYKYTATLHAVFTELNAHTHMHTDELSVSHISSQLFFLC